jgi:hypothetical protein
MGAVVDKLGNLVVADTSNRRVVTIAATPLYDVKGVRQVADGTAVRVEGKVVTAKFPGFFYIEDSDRAGGIRVDSAASFNVGDKASVYGSAQTNANGERYIAAFGAIKSGTGSLSPLAVTNRALGGGRFGPQEAVWSWSWQLDQGGNPVYVWTASTETNNIGLLVKVFGKVTQIDTSGQYFYIDDGSKLSDATQTNGVDNTGVRVASDGRSYTQGKFLAITGASSCFKGADGKLRRLLRVRSVQAY